MTMACDASTPASPTSNPEGPASPNPGGASPTITATTDRRRALDGADYAINMIQVGGYQPSTAIDFAIPTRYGLRQTIADTLGIGGIMRALRTIPVMLDMTRDMEEVCPDVTFLNYTNPMAMLCWALSRTTPIKTVGLTNVAIALHPEVEVTITLNIARTTDEAERQAKGETLTTAEAIYGEDINENARPESFFDPSTAEEEA